MKGTDQTGVRSAPFKTVLTRVVNRRIFNSSKQSQPAMTIQVYTQIMVGRKPIVIFYDALVGPKRRKWLPIYDFAAELQKAKSKLLHEWDNTAHCPVAISDVGACLQARGNLVALYHKAKGR